MAVSFSSLQQLFDVEGEFPLELIGNIGKIEAFATIPKHPINYFAFLGHPHSLHGGTMNNKVVTTVAKAFKELSIPSLRFNFRGVGDSSGHFDNGIGESEDLVFLIKELLLLKPEMNIILAGFSFGSYVTYRAACQVPVKLLISLAPPVHHYNYKKCELAAPWVIIQGNQDELIPYSLVEEFSNQASPLIQLIEFDNTSHFFHGKLIELKTTLIKITRNTLHLL